MIRLLIADDTLIAREGWKRILDSVDDISVIGEAVNSVEMLNKVSELKPDILLTDLNWFGDESAGWSAIKDIKNSEPNVKIIAVTAYENLIPDARRAGADAALTKTFTKDELLSVIRFLASERNFIITESHGDTSTILSSREIEVLKLLAEQNSDTEIASKLMISSNTVKTHMKVIFNKLNAPNRLEALKIARINKLIK